MKASFLNHEQPLLCGMIQCHTPEECISKIKKSLELGATALGIQLCKLKREYRTEKILREIFTACEGKPIYVTSYRTGESQGMTDDECADLLLLALRSGATLCDVYGDMYDSEKATYQLTMKPDAVKKQTELIAKIHEMGGEVLISCHTGADLTAEESLFVAEEQARRGADVIKIVNVSKNGPNASTHLKAIEDIVSKTGKKLLYLVSADGVIIRYLAPSFGACMYLCLAFKGEMDTKDQPLIEEIVALRKILPR